MWREEEREEGGKHMEEGKGREGEKNASNLGGKNMERMTEGWREIWRKVYGDTVEMEEKDGVRKKWR